jgi:hypothetical protein
MNLLYPATATIPAALRARSGHLSSSICLIDAFELGRGQRLYCVGLNPGKDPEDRPDETIERGIRALGDPSAAVPRKDPEPYHLRIMHMLRRLGFDPELVPVSNVILARSAREQNLGAEKQELLEAFWPFHRTIIAMPLASRSSSVGSVSGFVQSAIGDARG